MSCVDGNKYPEAPPARSSSLSWRPEPECLPPPLLASPHAGPERQRSQCRSPGPVLPGAPRRSLSSSLNVLAEFCFGEPTLLRPPPSSSVLSSRVVASRLRRPLSSVVPEGGFSSSGRGGCLGSLPVARSDEGSALRGQRGARPPPPRGLSICDLLVTSSYLGCTVRATRDLIARVR